MKTIFILLSILCLDCFSQEPVTAITDKTFQRVTLYPNGTWKYQDSPVSTELQNWSKKENASPENLLFMTDKRGVETKIIPQREDAEILTYKKNPYDKDRFIRKSEVFLIRYPDGTRDVFKDGRRDHQQISEFEIKKLAHYHVKWYYKEYRHGYTQLTACASLSLTPLIGLVPAIVFSKSKTSPEGLRIPNNALAENPIYFKEYSERAFERKKRKIWLTYIISSAVGAGIAAVIIGASTQ